MCDTTRGRRFVKERKYEERKREREKKGVHARGNTKQPVGELLQDNNRIPTQVLRNLIDEIYGYMCTRKAQVAPGSTWPLNMLNTKPVLFQFIVNHFVSLSLAICVQEFRIFCKNLKAEANSCKAGKCGTSR